MFAAMPPITYVSSPLTRGCFRDCQPGRGLPLVLPAHAGVLPVNAEGSGVCTGPPRSRGGASRSEARRWSGSSSSPLTRGCFRRRVRRSEQADVLPAHAGVLPPRTGSRWWRPGPPRSRGGASEAARDHRHARPSSPLTRGCFPAAVGGQADQGVLPAHAGVLPSRRPGCQARACPPRSRGGASWSSFMVGLLSRSSPLTRGCFRWRPGGAGRCAVLPAHAGVLPPAPTSPCRWTGPPRSRGGASKPRTTLTRTTRSSPLTRGCFPSPSGSRRIRRVLPAHAGVLPRLPLRPRAAEGPPRSRGGVDDARK